MNEPLRTEPPSLIRAPQRVLVLGLLAILMAAPVLAGSVSYTYDSMGRLKTASYSTGVVITYTYDAAGNRISQVTTGVP